MSLGRLLIVSGLVLICVGAVVLALGKLQLPLGRLPGDIVFRGKRTTFYFPLVTCLLLSLLGTLIMWILGRRP